MTYRYFIKISYDGYGFLGSQKQPNNRTVYGELELALNGLFKQCLRCVPCGRTDAGVHAQVSWCHCDFNFKFDPSHVMPSLNHALIPKGIIVRQLFQVSKDVHALSSAASRSYAYYFTCDHEIPNYLLHSVTHVDKPLMFVPTNQDLASLFTGKRNFFSLCNIGSASVTTIRDIHSMSLSRLTYETLFRNSVEIYCFQIVANAFLYKMVRHIVGILLHSMMNFTNMSRLYDYLIVHRPIAYSLAPPRGLHLTDVDYNNDTKVVKS